MLRSFVVRWAARLVVLVLALSCLFLVSRPKAIERENVLGSGQGERLALSQSERRERRRRARQEKTQGKKKSTDEKADDQPKSTAPPVSEGTPTKPPATAAPDAKAADPKSARPPPSATAVPVPPAEVPVERKDVWTDQELIAALQACVRDIGPVVAEIEPATPVRAGQCGAAAPVMVRRVGAAPGVEFRPPAMLNCAMVARLHQWVETVVQPSAREVFGAPIATLTNLSGYECRFRNNATLGKLSEHAFANALDIGGFVTADKRKLDVLSHWGPTARDLEAQALAEAAKKEGKEPKKGADPPLDNETKRDREKIAAKKAEGGRDDRARGRSSSDTRGRGRESKSQKGADGSEADPENAEADGKRADDKTARRRGKRRGVEQSEKEERAELDQDARRGKRTARDVLPVPAKAAATVAPPATPERTFLTRVQEGACGIFTTVLGPEANEAHRNHFHLDLAPRKRRAFCE